MELRKISLEDVYPDPGNPRSKENFGDLAAMAESFALNAASPGEPFNPIVVVRDGGIYRIVDGERRYRAMRVARTASCHAIVCDDMDEANAMLAMVATDDKRQLTDVERSRGVQQMLLLGVDPEKVERAGRMDRGSARRVRRAMASVEDAAEEMSLDRLLAIADLEDEGATADELKSLADCTEASWRGTAARIRTRIETDAAVREMERALADAGAAVLAKRPEGYETWGVTDDAADAAAEVAAALERHDDVAASVSRSYGRARASIYVAGGAEEPEEAATREAEEERAEKLLADVSEVEEDLERWYVSAANVDGARAETRRELLRSWLGLYGKIDRVREAAARAGLNFAGGLRYECVGAVAVAMWTEEACLLSSRPQVVVGASRGRISSPWQIAAARSWLALLGAAKSDGWSHEKAETIMDAVASAIAEDEED